MNKNNAKQLKPGWRHWWGSALLLAAAVWPAGPANAQAADAGSVWSDWRDDIAASRWETGITAGGLTVIGFRSWEWGSNKRFNFNPEGWFGKDTGSGGADKLGHAFTSYAITNVVADRLVRQGRSPERAALSAALTAQTLMLYVEVFDGLSNDHGFAREDVVVNLLGTGLAYARTVNPQLRDTLDFRMEYQASGYKGFRPFSDYSGQKFLLAFKLGGLPSLRDTPWRYLELQAGYYTRGFSRAEKIDGLGRSRNTFVGVGLNLNELLLGRRPPAAEAELRRATRLFFEHIQLPHTAVRATRTD